MQRILMTFVSLCLLTASAQALDKVTVGTVPTVGDGPLICAIERGYFRDLGLDVELLPFPGVMQMTPLLARGDLKMMGGPVSASFFNGIARGLPLRYFVDRARSPVWHGLIVRKELANKVKTAHDIKGLTIGVSGPGGVSEYEVGKWLEGAGLRLSDIQTKTLGMPESVAAVLNGAIDGAVFVPPFDAAVIAGGGFKVLNLDESVSPRLEVSGIIYNSDWAQANMDVVDRFTVGHIKGGRCYMEAARRGPNRAEMIGYLVKYGVVKDPALYENQNWSELDRNGRIMVDSLIDQQDFYFRHGYVTEKLPASAIIDEGPVNRALAQIGVVADD